MSRIEGIGSDLVSVECCSVVRADNRNEREEQRHSTLLNILFFQLCDIIFGDFLDLFFDFFFLDFRLDFVQLPRSHLGRRLFFALPFLRVHLFRPGL